MTEKLRIGVVGTGYMGSLHAQHFAAHEHVDLVGVVDIDSSQAQSVGDSVGCAAYTDPCHLLGEIDAVSIAVPSVLHREVAEIFLCEGIHMLMEKPLASSVSDAETIVERAQDNNAKLLVGHQERFNSAIMGIAHRIDRPKYIETNREGQFAGRGGDVDVITDLMIHDIDLVLAMVKSPVETVSALGASVVTAHVDIANARLEFENGTVANVTASRVSKGRARSFKIYMPHQILDLDLLDQSVRLHSKIDGIAVGSDRTGERIDTVPTITLKHEIDHFVDIVQNGGTPFVSGDDAVSALRVAQMVREKIDLH